MLRIVTRTPDEVEGLEEEEVGTGAEAVAGAALDTLIGGFGLGRGAELELELETTGPDEDELVDGDGGGATSDGVLAVRWAVLAGIAGALALACPSMWARSRFARL